MVKRRAAVSLILAASLDLFLVCLWWLGVPFPDRSIPMRVVVFLLLPGLIVSDRFFLLGHWLLGPAVAAVINSVIYAAGIFCMLTAREYLRVLN